VRYHNVNPQPLNVLLLYYGLHSLFYFVGTIELDQIEWMLKIVAQNLPFRARIVTQEMLDHEAAEKERLENENINPFTFKHAAYNNMLGSQAWLSKYDYIWHNNYR